MGTPVTLPGVYTMLVEYANTSDPSKTWRNTYDFFQSSLPQIGDSFANAMRQWAISMIHADAHLAKVAVYNWAKGRQPYPTGQPIWSESLTTAGTAEVAWVYPGGYVPAPVGGEVVLRVDREHAGGARPGRLFLRTLLQEADLQSAGSGEKWTITLVSPITQAHLNSIVAGAGLTGFLNQTPPGTGLCVVQYSPKTNVVHGFIPQTSFTLIGASTNKQTRKNKK
jgi:hypothetical protein